MITEIYIKGIRNKDKSACAVVIVEGNAKDRCVDVIHSVAWCVPETFEYEGEKIEADTFNCEILAAIYAIRWCKQNGKKIVNIYSDNNLCEAWYYRREFPGICILGRVFSEECGEHVDVYAERICGKLYNEYAQRVCQIAEEALKS